MSAVPSIGSGSQSLLLQELQKQAQEKEAARADAMKARFQQAAQAAGVDPTKVDDLQKQIQAAAQKAAQDPANAGNRQTAVQNAIDSVLKANGVDADKFKAAMQSAEKASGHRGHHRRQGVQGASASTQTSAQTSESQANAAESNTEAPGASDSGAEVDVTA
jgi:hypothetical protein